MAWLFVRLKLSLITGGLRGPGSAARITGLVVAIIGALFVMPLGFTLLALQHGNPEATGVVVVTFTVVTLGWLVLPMATFGADETLDPARLTLLPLRPGELARGLLAAALTGIGPILTFVVLLGAVVAVADGAVSAVIGVLAVAVELGLCVAGSRALITALSGLLRSRRGRDLGVLIGGLLSISLFATNMAFQHSLIRGDGQSPSGIGLAVTSAATIARWTPPGMAAHAIADAASGRYAVASIDLGGSAATVALLIWIWILALRRALESPDSSTAVRGRDRQAVAAGAATSAGLAGGAGGVGWAGASPARLPGWLRRMRASRAVNVAGRELRYYRRDPRRKQQLVNLAMPVFLILANTDIALGAGLGLPVWPAVVGGAIAGMFSSANQFGMDGSALWMNVVASSRWQDLRADLAGKSLAGAVITIPVFAILYTVVGILTGSAGGAAVAFAIAVCALGATSAVATMVSVLIPVPVPERRSSAFSSGGAGQGCLAALATFSGLGVAVAAMTPVFVLHAVTRGGAWVLVAAPCYGAALAWAGRRAAAMIGFRRMPEVLAAVGRPI